MTDEKPRPVVLIIDYGHDGDYKRANTYGCLGGDCWAILLDPPPFELQGRRLRVTLEVDE